MRNNLMLHLNWNMSEDTFVNLHFTSYFVRCKIMRSSLKEWKVKRLSKNIVCREVWPLRVMSTKVNDIKVDEKYGYGTRSSHLTPLHGGSTFAGQQQACVLKDNSRSWWLSTPTFGLWRYTFYTTPVHHPASHPHPQPQTYYRIKTATMLIITQTGIDHIVLTSKQKRGRGAKRMHLCTHWQHDSIQKRCAHHFKYDVIIMIVL